MNWISSKAAGSLKNKYGVTTKEKQNEEFIDGSGLEWNDFGARMQDPQIGRWHNIDLLSEKYANITVYNYCNNNPIKFTDPTGMEIEGIEGGVRFTGEDAIEAFNLITEKKSNVYIAVVGGDSKRRDEINDKKKEERNGSWAVFAISSIEKAFLALHTFDNLDNVVFETHGAQRFGNSYIRIDDEGGMCTSGNAILTEDIKEYNTNGSTSLDLTEKVSSSISNLLSISEKIKKGGNFIFAVCHIGEGSKGVETINELKILFGDRVNIFLAKGDVNTSKKTYSITGLTIDLNRELGNDWIKISPGIKSITNIAKIKISSSQNPVTIE